MGERTTALVVGASGIIGGALVETLSADPGWKVRALRRSPAKGDVISVDLLDRDAASLALRAAADTTHVFYAALAPRPDLGEEERVNAALLRNLLDGLAAARAPLERVVLYQGAKVYGVHLGRAHAPFYEDDPRHLGPNFYYAQEDLLRERARSGAFEWAILRPDVVVGGTVGNPMNIAVAIGVFAALSKAQGIPLRFPGSWTTYDAVLAQVTDAHWLARASRWAARAPEARDQAFNVVGEPFRWRRIWERVAVELGMEPGPPQPLSLARHMPSNAEAWSRIVAQHGLRDVPIDRVVSWAFGDFVFSSGFDVVSDMGKIRRAGFVEPADNDAWFRAAFARLRERKVLA